MTTPTLSTALMGVALVLILFSDKLFKQHEKIGKIICTIIVLVAVLLNKAALSYFKNTGICLSYSFFLCEMYIDKINNKLITSIKLEAKKGREKGRD